MAKLRLAVLASGRGSNLQAIIDAIESGQLDAEIAIVISDQEDAPALERARQQGLRTCFLDPAAYPDDEAYNLALLGLWRIQQVDAVILAGYMRMLHREVIEPYRNRILNIHPSLLPAFPGLRAQAQAVDYGVKYTGCTVHFVDEGMDTGPIILQAVVPVEDGDDEITLGHRILQEEHKLYPRALQLYAQGKLVVEGRRVRILD